MGKKILVVDDDHTMLTFVHDVLEAGGYEVTCADGGQEAIDILEESRFDCVVLDYHMPDKDGFDVMGAMYKHRDRTPTIVFTSKVEPHHEAALQGLGNVKMTLKKPCKAEALLKAVGDVIREETPVS